VTQLVISPETRAQIRRYFYAEHWKVGTIASQLGVHPDMVRNAIETERFRNVRLPRPSTVDPYLEFTILADATHGTANVTVTTSAGSAGPLSFSITRIVPAVNIDRARYHRRSNSLQRTSVYG
jgi:hypothetical protein